MIAYREEDETIGVWDGSAASTFRKLGLRPSLWEALPERETYKVRVTKKTADDQVYVAERDVSRWAGSFSYTNWVVVRIFALPTWHAERGWIGGAPGVVYAFVDRLTGNACVSPARDVGGAPMNPQTGPNADVRVATRAEAELAGWRSGIGGWKVAE